MSFSINTAIGNHGQGGAVYDYGAYVAPQSGLSAGLNERKARVERHKQMLEKAHAQVQTRSVKDFFSLSQRKKLQDAQ